MRQSQLARLVLAAGLLALASCSESPPEEPAELLGGHRYVVPATRGGLELPDDCDIDSSFIPVAKCASAPERKNLRVLRKQLLTLRGSPQADDRLYDWVSADLASGAADSETARQAVAIIQRGLTLGEDGAGATGSRRAQLLTDLSAAYLLVAEETQSALEVLAALEASLEALEIEDVPEARFNRDLALVLLGVSGPGDVEGEPVLRELAASLAVETELASSFDECPSDSDLGRMLDQWSVEPETSRPDLNSIAGCLSRSQDRFLPTVLSAAAGDPRVLDSWRDYRSAQDAFFASDQKEFRSALDRLSSTSTLEQLRLASTYFEALLPFQDADYPTAEAILAEQAETAREQRFFGLAAQATKVNALIAGMNGEYRLAIDRSLQAIDLASKASAKELTGQVQLQLISLLEHGGQDLECWKLLPDLIRTVDVERHPVLAATALSTAARLSLQRSYPKAALALQDRAVRIIEQSASASVLIELLMTRANFHLDSGNVLAARHDVSIAWRHFDSLEQEKALGLPLLKADLEMFSGMVGETPESRISSLLSSYQKLKKFGYRARLGTLQVSLARSYREAGRDAEAQSVLEEGLAELKRQTLGVDNWAIANGLVAAARPLTEELVSVLLARGQEERIPEFVRSYLSLRSSTEVRTPVPDDTTRWTIFSLPDTLVHIVENASGASLTVNGANRASLSNLRNLLLSQLSSFSPEEQIQQTAKALSETLLTPVEKELSQSTRLIIVADDSIAGLPFAILRGNDDVPLIEHYAISNAVNDLGFNVQLSREKRPVVVGASISSITQRALPHAEQEASRVAALYPSSGLLIGADATVAGVLDALRRDQSGNRSILHVASHFELNSRSPMDSSIVLNSRSVEVSRLALRELIEAKPDGFDLLYLSGCETGSALPPAPHGIFSVAQAIRAAGVRRAVVTLWDLADDAGMEMAVRFHEEMASGREVDESLRTAQLEQEHAGRHPGAWAAVALYR